MQIPIPIKTTITKRSNGQNTNISPQLFYESWALRIFKIWFKFLDFLVDSTI